MYGRVCRRPFHCENASYSELSRLLSNILSEAYTHFQNDTLEIGLKSKVNAGDYAGSTLIESGCSLVDILSFQEDIVRHKSTEAGLNPVNIAAVVGT